LKDNVGIYFLHSPLLQGKIGKRLYLPLRKKKKLRKKEMEVAILALANIDKASACHIERINTKENEMKVAILALANIDKASICHIERRKTKEKEM
jgi:hypothetical protein